MHELNQFFKMLSDETRFRIIMLLYYDDLVVCQISAILALSQPKVSKHLTKLRDTGLVKNCRKDQFVSYSLNIQDPAMQKIIEDIAQNIDHYPELKKDVEKVKHKNDYLCEEKKESKN